MVFTFTHIFIKWNQVLKTFILVETRVFFQALYQYMSQRVDGYYINTLRKKWQALIGILYLLSITGDSWLNFPKKYIWPEPNRFYKLFLKNGIPCSSYYWILRGQQFGLLIHSFSLLSQWDSLEKYAGLLQPSLAMPLALWYGLMTLSYSQAICYPRSCPLFLLLM